MSPFLIMQRQTSSCKQPITLSLVRQSTLLVSMLDLLHRRATILQSTNPSQRMAVILSSERMIILPTQQQVREASSLMRRLIQEEVASQVVELTSQVLISIQDHQPLLIMELLISPAVVLLIQEYSIPLVTFMALMEVQSP